MNKSLNDIVVIFSGDCTQFFIEFYTIRTQFTDNNKLTNITGSGSEYLFGVLRYTKYNNKDWEADNLNWVFSTFYKALKKSKFDKLLTICFENNDCDYTDLYKEQFIDQLKLEQYSILNLLKSIKKEYNLVIDKKDQ